MDLSSYSKASILDFGCGDGSLLDSIDRITDGKHVLYGQDSGIKDISAVREKNKAIRYSNGKFIDKLDYDDSFFDILVSVDTLECLVDKDAFLNETWRVLKPGGRVIVAHWDWDTQVYNSSHKDLMRKMVHKFCDWKQNWMDACDGQMGRKLLGLMGSSGKFKGFVGVQNMIETDYAPGYYGFDRLADLKSLVRKGEIDQSEYETVLKDMASLAVSKTYFYSVSSFIYSGNRT